MVGKRALPVISEYSPCQLPLSPCLAKLSPTALGLDPDDVVPVRRKLAPKVKKLQLDKSRYLGYYCNRGGVSLAHWGTPPWATTKEEMDEA